MKTWWQELFDYLVKLAVQPPGPYAGSVVKDIGWTGHDGMADQAEARARLLAAGEALVEDPELKSHDTDGKPGLETFCNWGVRRLAVQIVGYHGFDGKPPNEALTANEIMALCESSPLFREDSSERAAAHADRGGYCVAGASEHPHGHVATVMPGILTHSGQWGGRWPLVANIGKAGSNGIKPANFAFTKELKPRFFLYQPEDA